MGFETFLRLVADGDPVEAGRVNRPLRQVDQNTRYVWEVLQAAGVGSTVYARRVAAAEDVVPGVAVYFDPLTRRFARGLAAAELDEAAGVVVTAPSAQVWGVVARKHQADLVDVLLFGVADVDLSAAVVDGPPDAGVYYLSAVVPGGLTRQRPPVSVPVLRRTPDGRVFVMPQFVDFLDRHTHYQFRLVCRPAGATSPPPPGGRHRVVDGNALLPGWLPADHPVFAGRAPAGAVFGYNLQAHPALRAAWPPVPVSSAWLEWCRGAVDFGFVGVPTGPGGLAVLDRNGVWWLSDCYGEAPWPAELDTAASESYPAGGPDCPRRPEMEMRLYFSRVNFATDAAAVLSLRSGDSRIKVRCYGDPARSADTGHLELTLDFRLVVRDGVDGHLALKTFDPDRNEFGRGPVVEGVYALSPNVSLVGGVRQDRVVDGVTRPVHQGLVGLAVVPADSRELPVQLVRLDGAEEAAVGDPPLMYLELARGDLRGYRGRVDVPADLAVAAPRLRLRLLLLGRVAGVLPPLAVTARVVPRPPPGGTAALPGDAAEFAVACPTAVALASANQVVEVQTADFPVSPGDTVYFSVTRAASDAYPGAVGVVRQAGVVVSAA